MEEILKKYKERLINLSGRNRSLLCRTLPKKRGFDLVKLEEFEEGITSKILTYLNEEENKKLCILDDYNKVYAENKAKAEKEIKVQLKEELNRLKELKVEDDLYNIRVQSIKNKAESKLAEAIKKLEVKRERQIDYGVSLKALAKEVQEINKETGRQELYIGYLFVEGKLKDDTFIRGPLVLIPVHLVRQGDTWHLEKVGEGEFLINQVLLLGIAKHNEIKTPDIQLKYEKLEENFEEEILVKLAKEHIIINQVDEDFCRFKDYKKDTTPNYQLGELVLKKQVVIGQFPIANSIYTDYEALLAMETIEDERLSGLLKARDVKENLEGPKEEHGKLSFSESQINCISPLDYSQEKAVLQANLAKELVIYGPPGTGKSQTITNIIGDALTKNKTVLMVSQKRAALDVIYNRLGKLNAKAIILHDAQADKKAFYAKMAAALEQEKGVEDEGYTKISNEAQSIDRQLEKLEYIAEIFQSERSFGLTLQEMYSKCHEMTSREDAMYEPFKHLLKHNELMTYDYQTLEAGVKSINKEILEASTLYEKLIQDNPFIDDVDLNMNIIDIDELSEKVKHLVEPIKNITKQSKNNPELYARIMAMYANNHFVSDLKQIEEIALEFNHEENKSLLEPINDGKWWSIKYWCHYKKNKQKEQENALLYKQKEEAWVQKVRTSCEQIDKGLQDMVIIKKALDEKVYKLVMDELLSGEDLTTYFEEIIGALNAIEKYRNQLRLVRSLNEVQHKILRYCMAETDDRQVMHTRLENLITLVTLSHVQEAEKEDAVQKAVTYLQEFEKTVDNINELLMQKQDNVQAFIMNYWENKTNALQNIKGFKEFKRQAGKKRALWSIRQYIEKYEEMILSVFPCFLISPETASEILPLKKDLFDVVIFDEASQMYAENAMPVIYRGKQIIIAGDDKQLRPSGTFNSRYVELETEDEEQVAALEEESLLDLAKIHYKSVHLNYHYRSRYAELINFSNYAFYNGSLKIAPNSSCYEENQPPIERKKVEGRWIERENIEEAEEVVNLISKLFKERANKETLGIITFNINQKACIERMLEKRAQEDEEFRASYIEEIDRIEHDEDVSLFVKNIENVQGDERDIIIFSTGYAKNENNRVSVNFGLLSQDGGENRLNVAISRAKQKIYVVTSIEPEELQVENTKNKGPLLFKKYLQYVREISEGHGDAAQEVLNSVLDSQVIPDETRRHDSDFEAEVYEALVAKGYKVHTQIGVSGYKIDLGIYDEETNSYIVGIECDGAIYHSSKSARERDIHRQRYLESRGWKIIRIWSRCWWANKAEETERIVQLVNKLKQKEAE